MPQGSVDVMGCYAAPWWLQSKLIEKGIAVCSQSISNALYRASNMTKKIFLLLLHVFAVWALLQPAWVVKGKMTPCTHSV